MSEQTCRTLPDYIKFGAFIIILMIIGKVIFSYPLGHKMYQCSKMNHTQQMETMPE